MSKAMLLPPAFLSPAPIRLSQPRLRIAARTPLRPRWRAAAAGAPSSIPLPDDASNRPDQTANPDQTSDSQQESPPPPPPHQPLANLSQPAIDIDLVKKVPAALIDATGALQYDDGSLSTAVLPRRLVKRTTRGRFDLNTLKAQLAAGFDSGAGATFTLMLLFGTWYWANTAFNVYNKQVLKVFPYPLTCTVVQFAVAGIGMACTWLLRVKKPPRLNAFLFKAGMPLAFLHAAGFLLTNMSLGKVSVAFTHTVKSTEPFFSVALTPSILGDVPTWGILVSLLPIVGGVALASATEVSFNWIGFFAAVGSNIALQSRNVLSKKLMNSGSGKGKLNGKAGKQKQEMSREEEKTLDSLDNINLFSTMTIMAFFILAPICLLFEGLPLLSLAAVSPLKTGMTTARLFRMLALGGVCRCLDVLSSYMILRRVSPVTHSVGNCVKRAVVIVVSIFFFKTTMTYLNIAGTILALSGVFLYSIIVSACKQNTFGPDSPFCRPIYETDQLELTEGGGI